MYHMWKNFHNSFKMTVLHGPSEKQMEVIMLQIGETEEIYQDNLERFRCWAESQPHIPKKNYDILLPLFLRGCKHNVIRAQEKLSEFYIVRATCDTLYSKWDPQDPGIVAARNFMEYAPMPHLTDEGYRVVIHRIQNQDDAGLRDLIRMMLMLADLRMEQEHALAGDIYIFDVKNLHASFLVKLINPLLKKALNIVQYAYPQRLKQIHVLNAPNYVYNMVALFKGLMKKKMKDRFIIHTSQETLFGYIPRRILPSDYKGDALSIAELNRQWSNKLLRSKKTFQDMTYYNWDNSSAKHVNAIKTRPDDDIYGASGIFKTLNID